jgi:hypothetical protein
MLEVARSANDLHCAEIHFKQLFDIGAAEVLDLINLLMSFVGVKAMDIFNQTLRDFSLKHIGHGRWVKKGYIWQVTGFLIELPRISVNEIWYPIDFGLTPKRLNAVKLG